MRMSDWISVVCAADLGVAVVWECGEDGAGQGVLAAGLQGGRDVEDLFAGLPGDGGDLNDGRLIVRQGAGLVQRDGPDATHGLQSGATLHPGSDAAGGADGGPAGDRPADGQRAGRSSYEHEKGEAAGRRTVVKS